MKNQKAEIATLLTLSLVLIGALITLGTSLFISNKKTNIASNPRAEYGATGNLCGAGYSYGECYLEKRCQRCYPPMESGNCFITDSTCIGDQAWCPGTIPIRTCGDGVHRCCNKTDCYASNGVDNHISLSSCIASSATTSAGTTSTPTPSQGSPNFCTIANYHYKSGTTCYYCPSEHMQAQVETCNCESAQNLSDCLDGRPGWNFNTSTRLCCPPPPTSTPIPTSTPTPTLNNDKPYEGCRDMSNSGTCSSYCRSQDHVSCVNGRWCCPSSVTPPPGVTNTPIPPGPTNTPIPPIETPVPTSTPNPSTNCTNQQCTDPNLGVWYSYKCAGIPQKIGEVTQCPAFDFYKGKNCNVLAKSSFNFDNVKQNFCNAPYISLYARRDVQITYTIYQTGLLAIYHVNPTGTFVISNNFGLLLFSMPITIGKQVFPIKRTITVNTGSNVIYGFFYYMNLDDWRVSLPSSPAYVVNGEADISIDIKSN